MEYTYTIPVDLLTGETSTTIILRSDGAYIPVDEANSDYQTYLNKDTLVTESAPTA